MRCDLLQVVSLAHGMKVVRWRWMKPIKTKIPTFYCRDFAFGETIKKLVFRFVAIKTVGIIKRLHRVVKK
jgi:hypothetical protein